MKKSVIAISAAALIALAGSTYVYAQRLPGGPFAFGPRMTVEDVVRNSDVRIAQVKADLKLTPDQEKLWPAFEDAVKTAIKQGAERMQALRANRPDSAVERLRLRAQMMSDGGAALAKIADAADPLYKVMDDAQRHRLAALAAPHFGPRGWRDHDRRDWRDDRHHGARSWREHRDDHRFGWRDRDDRDGRYDREDRRDDRGYDRRDDRRDDRRNDGRPGDDGRRMDGPRGERL